MNAKITNQLRSKIHVNYGNSNWQPDFKPLIIGFIIIFCLYLLVLTI